MAFISSFIHQVPDSDILVVFHLPEYMAELKTKKDFGG